MWGQKKKKRKCHHLLIVWTEWNVAPMRPQWRSTEVEVNQDVPFVSCIHLHPSVSKSIHACVWRGGVRHGVGEQPRGAAVVLQGIWVVLWNGESQTEEVDYQLFSALCRCQQISLHKLFRFFFLSFFKTTSMFGTEGGREEKKNRRTVNFHLRILFMKYVT